MRHFQRGAACREVDFRRDGTRVQTPSPLAREKSVDQPSSRLIGLRDSTSGRVTCERPSDERVGVPVTHLVLGFEVPTIAMCFSSPQSAMIFRHSAIERPYFFSIDGKYDAGPCFGHGAVGQSRFLPPWFGRCCPS